MSLTVTSLARACGLSRSTVLYYEAMGLLKPARRSAGNYRLYGSLRRKLVSFIRTRSTSPTTRSPLSRHSAVPKSPSVGLS